MIAIQALHFLCALVEHSSRHAQWKCSAWDVSCPWEVLPRVASCLTCHTPLFTNIRHDWQTPNMPPHDK